MQQIHNLKMEEPVYCMIPEENHAEVLNTVWLTPQATYTKGGSFGEKAINNES